MQKSSALADHVFVLGESFQQQSAGNVAVLRGALTEKPFGALANQFGSLWYRCFFLVGGKLLGHKWCECDDENRGKKKCERATSPGATRQLNLFPRTFSVAHAATRF